MNVEYIDTKYKGKPIRLPLYFGMSTMARYGDAIGKTMQELFALSLEQMTFTECLEMVKAAINGGFRQAEIPAEYNEVQIERIIDGDPAIIGKIQDYCFDAQKAMDDESRDDSPTDGLGEPMPAPSASETS